MAHLNEFFVGFRNCGRDFKLRGIPKVHFLKSEWENLEEPERTSGPYLAWRGFYAVFSIFCVSYSLALTTKPELWLIYVTRWSIVCQLIYSVLFFLNNLAHRLGQSNGGQKGLRDDVMTLEEVKASQQSVATTYGSTEIDRTLAMSRRNNPVESILCVLMGIVVIVPVFVTLGYWTVVFPNVKQSTPLALSSSIFLHGINALVALVDFFVISIPIRVTHVLFSLLFFFLYVLFTLCYEFLIRNPVLDTAPYIYKVLNWREQPTSAGVATIISLVVIIVFYAALWLLYVLRLALVSRLSRRTDKERVHYVHQYWLHGEDAQK